MKTKTIYVTKKLKVPKPFVLPLQIFRPLQKWKRFCETVYFKAFWKTAIAIAGPDSIHWFDSLIRFIDSIPDSILWFDSLIRFLIVSLIRFHAGDAQNKEMQTKMPPKRKMNTKTQKVAKTITFYVKKSTITKNNTTFQKTAARTPENETAVAVAGGSTWLAAHGLCVFLWSFLFDPMRTI